MARWLSFFAEYKLSFKYKPGRLNVVADALPRQTDFELADQVNSETLTTVAAISGRVPSSTLLDEVRKGYVEDMNLLHLNLIFWNITHN